MMMPALYLEDLPDRWSAAFGRQEITREAIVSFAGQFDPQDFHLDDVAAARGPFGRLAASGWHTSCLAARMMTDEFERLGLKTLGSPGVEAINFLKPVHPGDVLTSEIQLIDRRVSNSRPDRIIATFRLVLRNQDNDVAWTARPIMFFQRKPDGAHRDVSIPD